MMRSAIQRLTLAAAVAVASAPAAARALAAQLPGAVRVEVREAGTDRPLADADVAAGAGATARTAPDGRALLRGLPPGPHTLTVRHLAYAPASVDVTVENGRTVETAVRLVPAPLDVEGLRVAVDALPAGAVVLRPAEAGPEVRDVAGLVEAAPGVSVIRRGGPGTPAVASIRGSSGDQVLVLVDGVAVNSPVTGEADLARLGLERVERVVVIPGTRAGRYGPGALAGAILVETGGAAASRGSATVEAGSLGRAGVDLAGTLAPASRAWSLAAGGSWRRAEGAFEYNVPAVRGGGTALRENAGTRALTGYLEASWAPTRGPEIRLRLHGRDARRGSPGTVVQPSRTGRHAQDHAGALLQGRAGDGEGGWRATLAADRHRADFSDPAPPFGPPYRARSRVLQSEARLEAWRPAGPLRLDAGADARLREIRADALDGEAPARADGAGGWVEAVLAPGEDGDRWLRATGTLRADVHDLLDGVVLSPSLSVLVGRGATTLEGSVGSAVSPPGLADLFFQEGVLARANPDLRPERVRGEVVLEAAHRFGAGPLAGEARLAGFRADVEGMILWFPDHRFVWSPHNVDVARRGLEASATLRGSRLAPLRASLSWTDVRYDQGVLDGQVVYRPRFEAEVGARVPTGPLAWTATWRRVGARRTRAGSELNPLPAFSRLDLGLAARLDAARLAATVELAVANALDSPAELLVDYPLPGRTWTLRVRLASDER